MSACGCATAVPEFPDDELLTMADVEAMAERLGLVIITDGKAFEYARPCEQRPGWRRFCMAQKPRPVDPKEPRA